MARKEDLEHHIRESYRLVRKYQDILRLSADPKEQARARYAIEEQWAFIERYLNEYLILCRRIGTPLPADITEIAARFEAATAKRVLPDDEEPSTKPPPGEASAVTGQEYKAFELLIGSKTAGGYPVTITHAPAGDAGGLCRLDPAADDLQAALRRLAAGDTDERFLMSLGRRLFDGLFTAEIATLFRASLGQVRGQGKGLRVRLRIEPPELAALPWEYMYDAQEDCFPAISPETPLVRYVPMPNPSRPIAVTPPLRVLVVISNPRDAAPLDVEQEKNIIEQALAKWVRQGLVQLRFLEHAAVAEIGQAMRSFRPHVFHFIGHGQFRDGKAGVILEDDDGYARWISARAFREFFLGLPDTRLAVLNACQTATTSSARSLTGLAPRILQRHLAAVTAMQYPISGRAALIFSREFYRSLALGYPVDAAISEARKGISLEVGSDARDWGTPVLFLRAQNGRLFDVALRRDRPPACFPRWSLQQQLSAFLSGLRVLAELPPDAPLYERLGNVVMYILGQIGMASIAAAGQLLALLILGGLWAWILAGGGGLDLQPWELLGIAWLGLTILPLIAGSLPQRREQEIYAMFDLKKRQRFALWLEKVFGIYVSAFLGEAAAIVIWLSLVYAGLWPNLSLTLKTAFWFVMVLITSALSLVGAAIAMRCSWNLSKRGQAPRLHWQNILLGVGFPCIVYPGLILFAWETVPIWSRCHTGYLAIGAGLLLLVWLIRRDAGR